MVTARRHAHLSLIAILLLGPSLLLGITAAQEAGDVVMQRGEIAEDFYAAGRRVDIDARVAGDVVVAGRELRVAGDIQGDVIAAGGNVEIEGGVADDARLVGGRIDIDAAIGDHLVVAGETVLLRPEAEVGGRAWMAGRRLSIDGRVGGELRAAATIIELGGSVAGDVELVADRIALRPGARIGGDLTYHSPVELELPPEVEITGVLVFRQLEARERSGPIGPGLLIWLSLAVTGTAIYLLHPGYVQGATLQASSRPWRSLAVGLLPVFGTPLLIALLVVLVVGVPLALMVTALWPVMLLTGYLLAAFILAERAATLIGRDLGITCTRWLWTYSVALLVLLLLQAVPVLGALVTLVALLMGSGAGLTELYERYRRDRERS